jgi:hypothetical protein
MGLYNSKYRKKDCRNLLHIHHEFPHELNHTRKLSYGCFVKNIGMVYTKRIKYEIRCLNSYGIVYSKGNSKEPNIHNQWFQTKPKEVSFRNLILYHNYISLCSKQAWVPPIFFRKKTNSTSWYIFVYSTGIWLYNFSAKKLVITGNTRKRTKYNWNKIYSPQ